MIRLFFSLFFVPLIGICQSNINQDSLYKYSYSIGGIIIDDTPTKGNTFYYHATGGSGFFITSHEQLFFVTANHVVSGCDSTGLDKYADFMSVFVPQYDTAINIYVRPYQDSLHCILINKNLEADIVEIPIPNLWRKKVGTVDSFISPLIKKYGVSKLFGYPGKLYTHNNFYKGKPPSLFFPKNKYYFSSFYNSESKVADTINFGIMYKNSPFDSLLYGYSGSPLLIQNKQTKQWRIGGCFTSAAKYPKQTMAYRFVKIETILKDLEDYYDGKKFLK